MRVIAGELKGRKLRTIPGTQTRPTSNKIKEAVFQMIGPFFHGGESLDLFAGSGSLGVEAISRGMDHVIFVDKDKRAIHMIEENLTTIDKREKAEVYKMDAFRALDVMEKNLKSFDLILIDPPYSQIYHEDLLNKIIKKKLLKKNAIIFCEHSPTEKLPKNHDNLEVLKQVEYGKTTGITIYRYLKD